MTMHLSFIIPVYNEIDNIDRLSVEVVSLEKAGHEVIVVDGGSNDGTYESLRDICHNHIESEKGRALQMNAGARHARGDVLVFLHADTFLPRHPEKFIEHAIQERPWGRFNVALTGSAFIYRVIALMMNLRSCITGIATGDQCIFVKKSLFDAVGGYAPISLMEDICLSKALKKSSRPYCITEKVVTSSRHWESRGVIRTIFLMWSLRMAYFLGVSPERLNKLYYKR